jgi:hypothetical protein
MTAPTLTPEQRERAEELFCAVLVASIGAGSDDPRADARAAVEDLLAYRERCAPTDDAPRFCGYEDCDGDVAFTSGKDAWCVEHAADAALCMLSTERTEAVLSLHGRGAPGPSAPTPGDRYAEGWASCREVVLGELDSAGYTNAMETVERQVEGRWSPSGDAPGGSIPTDEECTRAAWGDAIGLDPNGAPYAMDALVSETERLCAPGASEPTPGDLAATGHAAAASIAFEHERASPPAEAPRPQAPPVAGRIPMATTSIRRGVSEPPAEEPDSPGREPRVWWQWSNKPQHWLKWEPDSERDGHPAIVTYDANGYPIVEQGSCSAEEIDALRERERRCDYSDLVITWEPDTSGAPNSDIDGLRAAIDNMTPEQRDLAANGLARVIEEHEADRADEEPDTSGAPDPHCDACGGYGERYVRVGEDSADSDPCSECQPVEPSGAPTGPGWWPMLVEVARLGDDLVWRNPAQPVHYPLGSGERWAGGPCLQGSAPGEVEFSPTGEMSDGEAEIRVTVDEREGSAWLSHEMWFAIGEQVGWASDEQAKLGALAAGVRSVAMSLQRRATAARSASWAEDAQDNEHHGEELLALIEGYLQGSADTDLRGALEFDIELIEAVARGEYDLDELGLAATRLRAALDEAAQRVKWIPGIERDRDSAADGLADLRVKHIALTRAVETVLAHAEAGHAEAKSIVDACVRCPAKKERGKAEAYADVVKRLRAALAKGDA